MLWSEHGTGRVRSVRGAGPARTLHAFAPPLYDLRLVAAAARAGASLAVDWQPAVERAVLLRRRTLR